MGFMTGVYVFAWGKTFGILGEGMNSVKVSVEGFVNEIIILI